jgi:hypothetical protein
MFTEQASGGAVVATDTASAEADWYNGAAIHYSYPVYTLSDKWANLYEKPSSSCDRRRELWDACALRLTSTASRTRGGST